MAVNYDKLRKLLIDKKMLKKDLEKEAGLSKHTMLCIARNEHISTESIGKICKTLNCTFEEIAEFTAD